jgi:hypothetical protein
LAAAVLLVISTAAAAQEPARDDSAAGVAARTNTLPLISPTWTSDGKFVIATKGSDLWLYAVDGGSGVRLTGATGQPAPGAPFVPAVQYSGAAFGRDASARLERRARTRSTSWMTADGAASSGFVTELHRSVTNVPDLPSIDEGSAY